jgi:hypothetical protein
MINTETSQNFENAAYPQQAIEEAINRVLWPVPGVPSSVRRPGPIALRFESLTVR